MFSFSDLERDGELERYRKGIPNDRSCSVAVEQLSGGLKGKSVLDRQREMREKQRDKAVRLAGASQKSMFKMRKAGHLKLDPELTPESQWSSLWTESKGKSQDVASPKTGS